MSELEARRSVYLAILLNIGRLPQLKGKGMSRDPLVRDRGIQWFADAVADNLFINARLMRGPGLQPHCPPSTGQRYDDGNGK